jgi:hypothetical protein
VDLISNREPFGKFAILLFKKNEKGELRLYTSSHSLVTTHYLLKKYISENKLRKILLDLADLMTILPVNAAVLKKALRSQHKDFEDGVQIVCANSIKNMDFIVTRNLRDFRTSEIPAVSPDVFLEMG